MSLISVSPVSTPLPFKSRRPRFTSYLVYSAGSMYAFSMHLRLSSQMYGVASE